MVHMKNDLATWLANQLNSRGWSMRELARRADLSHSTISQVLAEQRHPTWDFCAQIAYALNISPEVIFGEAGLLPKRSPLPEENQAIVILRSLSFERREMALLILRAFAGYLQSTDTAQAPYAGLTDLERQLLDEFRRLPPAGQRLAFENVELLHQYNIRIIGEKDETETQAEHAA